MMRRCAENPPHPIDRGGAVSPRSTSWRCSTSTTDVSATATKGALLRREALYSSHMVEWRRARDSGALAGLSPKERERTHTPLEAELARTKKRAERAEAELRKTRLVIEIQGKASELLEQLLTESDEEEKQQR